MQPARFVWMLRLLLVLGLAGFGGGCSSGTRSTAELQEVDKDTAEARKGRHGELKAVAKKAQARADEGEGRSHRRGR